MGSAVWTRSPGHIECCRVPAGHDSGPPRSGDKTGGASGGRGSLRAVGSTVDMASSIALPTVEKAARLVEAMRPSGRLVEAMRPASETFPSVTKAARAAESLTAAFAPLADTLAGFKAAAESFRTRIPVGLLRTAQRWASMSPRQRARVLLAEVRRRARRVPAAFRAALSRALSRTRTNVDALTAQAQPADLHRPASPSHGPPLALVLLDSARPVHGPPVPA